MAKRVHLLAAGVLLFLAVAVLSPPGAAADEPAGQGPVFKHGLELRMRRAGEPDFNDKTKKVGVEFFLDGADGNGVYVGDAGDLATVAAKLAALEDVKVKAPEWSHGMELRPQGRRKGVHQGHEEVRHRSVRGREQRRLYLSV